MHCKALAILSFLFLFIILYPTNTKQESHQNSIQNSALRHQSQRFLLSKRQGVSPQVVMFNLEIGVAPQGQPAGKEEDVNHNKLEDMIKELATTLKTVKHEQEYMQVCATVQYIICSHISLLKYKYLYW